MPRPRILCSPRPKPQNTVENVNQRPRPQVVTISESEEPDCEIIKIEDDNNEKKKISIQVRGVAQVQYHGSQCLPSMLSLQFLPPPSSNITENTGGQNVMMVLPVSSSQSQLFNPTLCTLEKIENPNEISEIRKVVNMQENIQPSRAGEKQLKNTGDSALQPVCTTISTENLRKIYEHRGSDSINETTKTNDCIRLEPSTTYSTSDDQQLSAIEISSDTLAETVDSPRRAKTSYLRLEEPKDNASGNETTMSSCVELSDTSDSLGNREATNWVPKKTDSESNNSRTPDKKISLTKIAISKKSLIRNGAIASLLRKKGTGELNSSVERKAVSSLPKRYVDNKKTGSFVRKGMKNDPSSAADSATLMQKVADGVNSDAKSKESMFQCAKHTDDENTSEPYECFSPMPESVAEFDKNGNSRIALQFTESGVTNCDAELLWNLNCIVCNRKFMDRTQLHRHTSLAHPDVQIFYCEFCNDSFLTHKKLEAHRIKNCKAEVTEILETIVIEDEEDDPLPSEEISGNIVTDKIISETHKTLETQSIKKNKPPESQKVKTPCCSGGILIRRKRGRPRKNFANFAATHKHVEEEVINHAFGAIKKELVTAEIKKLVVPIARLEDSTLKKYLGKPTASPPSACKDLEEGSSHKNFRKRKRRRSRKNYDNVGNLKRAPKRPRTVLELKKPKTNLCRAQEMRNDTYLRRTDEILGVSAKKIPIYTDTDDDSDDSGIKYIPIVEEDDSGNHKRTIRKLPSRSSAASFASLKTGKRQRVKQSLQIEPAKTYDQWILRRQKPVDFSHCVETPVKKHTEPKSGSPPERLNMETVNDTKLDVVDHAQSPQVSNNLEENRQQNENGIGTSKKLVELKTYLPSKRKALNASKLRRRCDSMSDDLCLMCKELLELMKQLASHFDGDKANKISVKCPLCNLYFISMLYLKKHVSRFHLHCQKQFPSQLSKSLMLVKSENDENLRCRTEISLALECYHCTGSFSEEKDLVDHVFTLHVSSIFSEHTATDLPYYINDLPSTYFQTSSRFNSIESSSKRRPGNAVNRLIVKRKSPFLSSESVEDKTTNKSSKPAKSPKSTESPNNSTDQKLTSRPTEMEICNSEKIPSASKPTKEDQAKTDHGDLLKQLLSDDSRDSFNDPEPTTSRYTQEVPKLSRKVIFESEREFIRQCHICDKEFRRTQDLVIHSLEHDFPDESEEGRPNTTLDATNNLFADSIEYGWFNEELAASTTLEAQPEESETAAPIPQRIADDPDTSDVLFGISDESNDFSPVYESNDESGREMDDPTRKTASPASKLSSTNEKTGNFCTKESQVGERASKLSSEVAEPQTEKLKVLQEFLETEKGLTNPDEADSTGKLPIECSKCNRKFPNQASLNEHLFFLHDDSLKDTVLTDVLPSGEENSKEPRQWRCDECVHDFKLLQSYGRHRYFVHGDDEMVHVCENCSKVMTTVTMVNVHICTDVASYNCRTCNETFSTGISLRLHNMYKHKETEGPHKCLPCNKKFLTNAMLKRHERCQHRFIRPYRPNKRSPVHMATADDVPSKCGDLFEENEMDSGCDQEYVDMEYEFTRKESAEDRKQVVRSPEVYRKRRRSQEEVTPKQQSRNLQKEPLRQNSLVTYIDEDEIIQCNLCRLYCLSMAALRTHMANSHSIMGEVCRICEKMYPKGKLIRHMIDQHISPCETYTEDKESIWNVGKNVEEKDAEELIRMLGTSRFISLCEYQRFSESTREGQIAVSCPNCAEKFESCEDYKYHFLMNHDVMCALCNIEFKSGDKAAIHKTEDHGSVDSYIWFADQTVRALTAATNFSEAAEKSFIEMISIDSDESDGENEDEDCGEENQTSGEYFASKNDDKCQRVKSADGEESLTEFREEEDDQKLMIVVTDDDLRYYGIGTQNPNIWGLASKISSTSAELTPKDVKCMLDSYFGK